jgi:hypothetical protein
MVGTAKPGKAPVHLHVDEDPSVIEGAETFEQDAKITAWAQWHCKLVTVAQLMLITMSCIQLYLGLNALYGGIGMLPVISSIFGLFCSKQYFEGDVSSLLKTLNCVRLSDLLTFSLCNRARIDSFLLILDP